MSDNNKGWFARNILPWIHSPGTYSDDEEEERFERSDNIWSDFHLFDDNWVEIMNKVEWYQSPNVPTIYAEHKYVFRNIDMGRPYEEFYFQDVGTGEFESKMSNTDGLPSGKGELKLTPTIGTKAPPEGENDFGFVEYQVELEISYDMPSGITFLPRFLAYPLNRFFKWAFIHYIGEEMIEYDGEYAREKLYEYFEYIRKYHGEEPMQSKTREAHFKPSVEEGVFFQ